MEGGAKTEFYSSLTRIPHTATFLHNVPHYSAVFVPRQSFTFVQIIHNFHKNAVDTFLANNSIKLGLSGLRM